MKTTSLTILSLGLALLCSCSDKDPEVYPPPRWGTMNIEVVHHVSGNLVNPGTLSHTNVFSNVYQVDILNHFMSNFSFHVKDGGWTNRRGYRMVRYADNDSKLISIPELPLVEFDSVRFYIGLDSMANSSIEKMTDLDPSNSNMYWPWNTTFIFYKFEGKFINRRNDTMQFAYHIGGDEYLMEYSIPLKKPLSLSTDQTSQNFILRIDLAEIFKSPDMIDMNDWPLTFHNDAVFSRKLSDNLKDAITAE